MTLDLQGIICLVIYVLIGKNREEEEKRLRKVWDIGCMPFAQLYQPVAYKKYSREWKQFQRQWARPAIIRSMMKAKDVN